MNETLEKNAGSIGFGDNIFGDIYINETLNNVYARVYNTTDPYGASWNGPYRTSQIYAENRYNDGDWAYYSNVSLLWVNRSNYVASPWNSGQSPDVNGTPSILEICVNGSMEGNVPVRDIFANTTADYVGALFYYYPPCARADYKPFPIYCSYNRLYPGNFTQYYVRSWNFTDIADEQTADFAAKTVSLETYCDNHPKFSWNLSLVNTSEYLNIQTVERPRNILTYQGKLYVRQDLELRLKDHFWIDSLLPQTMRHTLTLNDYTGGDWMGSTLYIRESTPSQWANIHVEKYPAEAVIYPYLRNNTQYHLTLKTGTVTTDLGFMYTNGLDLERQIIVTDPITYKDGGVYANTSIKWTMDYGTGQVGAVVTASPGIEVNFSVYNTNGSSWVRVYNSNAAGTTTFTYTVPDKQQQYYTLVDVYDPSFGSHRFENMLRLYNRSLPLNSSAFYTPLPDTFMGMSTITAKKIFSLMFSLLIMYVACKASDYGFGAILGLATYGFFWFVNWLPHEQIPWWIIAVQLVMAASMKITERRYA